MRKNPEGEGHHPPSIINKKPLLFSTLAYSFQGQVDQTQIVTSPQGLFNSKMDSQVVLSPYMVGMKRMENLKGSLWNKGGDSTEGNGNTNGSDGQESFTRSFKRQKLEHTASSMPLAFTSPSPRSLTSTTHQPNKHRRRVHIQEDQTTEHHAPSEHSVFDEKAKLWYTREDFTVTLQSMKDAIRSPKETPDDCSLPNYGETLASTYLACCLDSNSSVSSCIPTSITPVHLEMLGIGRGDHRGMETCALPRLAAERNQKRREIIQNVVFLDKTTF